MISNAFESFKSPRVALTTTLSIVVATYSVMKWRKLKEYFRNYNILACPTPLPFIGNLIELVKTGNVEFDLKILDKYSDEKMVLGYFEGSTPVIICADPKMVKCILIKDFNCFTNKRVLEAYSFDPFDKFLSCLKDDEWKAIRSVLTPIFTTSKLKAMAEIMIPCTENFSTYIETLINKNQYFDAKQVFARYAVDVISSCFFGIKLDSINDPQSEFVKHAKNIIATEFSLKRLLFSLFPNFAKYTTDKGFIESFPINSFDSIYKILDEIIEKRKTKTEFRDDFIQSMIDLTETIIRYDKDDAEVQKGEAEQYHWKPSRKEMNSKEIITQAIMFLMSGYETCSSALTFVAYNLALNSDCQKRLCFEVDTAFKKHGKLSYEMVNDIPYLDMILNESLRLYPPTIRLERIASSDYKYNDMTIPKNSVVVIPVYALHHNPTYYPEPDKFIPERFSVEYKREQENNAVFLPFGLGLRNCIGNKFAYLEMKLLLCSILSKYQIEVCDKTPVS